MLHIAGHSLKKDHFNIAQRCIASLSVDWLHSGPPSFGHSGFTLMKPVEAVDREWECESR